MHDRTVTAVDVPRLALQSTARHTQAGAACSV